MVTTPLHNREGLGEGLLLEGLLGGGSHLRTIGILVAQHVTGKLDDHHLHAQTDAEGGDVVGATILRSDNLTLDATLSEARTNQYACHVTQLVGHIITGHLLAVDEMDLCLHVIVDACQVQTLADALVSVLQVVFAHQCNVHFAGSAALLVEEVVP